MCRGCRIRSLGWLNEAACKWEHFLQLLIDVRVGSDIGGGGDLAVRAGAGQDHSIPFECSQDSRGIGGKNGGIETGFEPEASSHGRCSGVQAGTGNSRPDRLSADAFNASREAQSMADDAALQLAQVRVNGASSSRPDPYLP